MRVGLVADTHGLFDPALPEIFRGVDLVPPFEATL